MYDRPALANAGHAFWVVETAMAPRTNRIVNPARRATIRKVVSAAAPRPLVVRALSGSRSWLVAIATRDSYYVVIWLSWSIAFWTSVEGSGAYPTPLARPWPSVRMKLSQPFRAAAIAGSVCFLYTMIHVGEVIG